MSTFTLSCNHCHHPSLDLPHLYKMKLLTHEAKTLHVFTSHTMTTTILSVSMNLITLGTSYK